MGCVQWPTAHCGDCNTLWQPLLNVVATAATRSPYNSFSHIRFCIRIRIRFRFHFGIHDDKRVICRPICRGTSFRLHLRQGKTTIGKREREGKGYKFGLAASSRFLPVCVWVCVETSLKVIKVVGQQCGQSIHRFRCGDFSFWLAVCCHLLQGTRVCFICAPQSQMAVSWSAR